MTWNITPHLYDIAQICDRAKVTLEDIRNPHPVPLHVISARTEIIELLHKASWLVEDIADFLHLSEEAVDYVVTRYQQAEKLKRSQKKTVFSRFKRERGEQ